MGDFIRMDGGTLDLQAVRRSVSWRHPIARWRHRRAIRCVTWEGDLVAPQPDPRPPIRWSQLVHFDADGVRYEGIRAVHDGPCVFVDRQCSCGRLNVGVWPPPQGTTWVAPWWRPALYGFLFAFPLWVAVLMTAAWLLGWL